MSPATLKLARKAKPGFVQARRLETLREALESSANGVTLEELAERLHVTQRSVRRYLAQLGAQVELEALTPVPGGAHAWRIKPSARPRALPLRRSQAYALLATSALFEPLRGSALHDELQVMFTELNKLATRPGRTASLSEVSAEAQLRGRFFAALPQIARPPRDRADDLDALFSALVRCQLLQFTHNERTVCAEPYALVLDHDQVVLIGWDRERTALAAWPISQICALSEQEESFELPEDFDVAEHFHGVLGFIDRRESHTVVVEFAGRAAEQVRTLRLHPEQRVERALRSNRVRLHFPASDLPRVARWLLGFGAEARVRQPVELVQLLAETARRLSALYPM